MADYTMLLDESLIVRRTVPSPNVRLLPGEPPLARFEVLYFNQELARYGQRWCAKCRSARPRAAFHPHQRRACRTCYARDRRTYEDEQRAARFRREYGMAAGDYAALLARQGGVCAICGAPPQRAPQAHPEAAPILYVDHDHATGAVRGLLCRSCNAGLGLLKDDAGTLERALAYLRASSLAQPDVPAQAQQVADDVGDAVAVEVGDARPEAGGGGDLAEGDEVPQRA
jgi:hypothetical protein